MPFYLLFHCIFFLFRFFFVLVFFRQESNLAGIRQNFQHTTMRLPPWSSHSTISFVLCMILLASWSKAQNDFSNDINNPQNPFDVTSSTPQSDTAFQNPNQNPLNRDYYGNNNNFGSNNNNFGGNSNFGGSNNFGNNDDYLASGRTSTPRPYDFGSSDYSNRNYNPRDPFN